MSAPRPVESQEEAASGVLPRRRVHSEISDGMHGETSGDIGEVKRQKPSPICLTVCDKVSFPF